MSTARKRTKASKETPKSQHHVDTNTISSPVAVLQEKAASSPGRSYLKALFGLLSVASLALAGLSYFQSDGQDSVFVSAPPEPSPDTERYYSSRKSSSASSSKFETSLPFQLQPRPPPSTVTRSADVAKLAAVKEAFQDSWSAYVDDAFGADEYHPISRSGSNFSIDGGVGYFIVDTLDVLLIMGEEEEYKRARDWVRNIDWSSRRGKFSVFETTIRTLGGLLSAHALCQPGNDSLSPITSELCSPEDSAMFLEKAVGLAERLKPAFEQTKFGIPFREIDFQSGQAFPDVDNRNMSSLAEVASIQLEFKYLAHATGDATWWTLAERPMQAIRNAGLKSKSDGLLPIFMSPYTGEMFLSGIRLGSRGDSYYEYLIKQYVQTNHSEAIYGNMYREAANGIKRHLLKQSEKSNFLYTAEIEPRMYQGAERPVFLMIPKQDHLVCFLGGSYMLGALYSDHSTSDVLDNQDTMSYPPNSVDDFTPLAQEDWTIGHELIRTCVDTYQGTKTGLAAEITMFRTKKDTHTGDEEDWYIKKEKPAKKGTKGSASTPLIDARNILRPETVESLFIAFHLTGDEIYREWGWQIFQAFVKITKIKEGEEGRVGAFTSIRNVESDVDQIDREDRMETFWLAETLKYLYLLFSDQDTLRLDQWVLNTEAHPLPIFQPIFETGVV
ncbi:hypothetical protein CBS101457_001657 [Exobasidium rhododendri]|nr:hypothetical protein CBS101457_001657 [Exobasidium rhododendri]